MGLPLKVVGTLVAKDMEKVEILDAFFASVSTVGSASNLPGQSLCQDPED